MAICRPKAIDDAPVFGPERSGGWRRGEFLVLREEWAKPRGRKSTRRRCVRGDRGAAALRLDHAIRGLVARAHSTATKGEDVSDMARSRGQPSRAKEKKRPR